MQRMFIDRKKQAKRRFIRATVAVSIVCAMLISLLLVIILVYGERTIVEGDTGEAYLAAEELEEPTIEEPPRVPVLQPLPNIRHEPQISEPAQHEEPSEIYETVHEPTPEQAPEPASEPEPEAVPEPEQGSEPEFEPEPPSAGMIAASESLQAVHNSALNWWQSLEETSELSDGLVLSSFIENFSLDGAYVTAFEVRAVSLEIFGTYNGGNFVIDLTFSGGGQGLHFVAWYNGGDYSAAWQSGMSEIKIVPENGQRPRIEY